MLFVNGTCGAGKTVVAAAAADHVASLGGAVAFIDMDELGQSWPRPADDPFNKALGIKNLAHMVQNFTDAGVTSVVIAGVMRDETDLARYEDALGARLAVVRLLAPLEVIDERLQRRYGDTDPARMAWHRQQAPELNDLLDASTVDMVTVANTASVPEVARSVLVACDWLPAAS